MWRILERLELNRLPSSQRYKPHKRRWKRYEKQLPGHRIQVDVKFIEPLKETRNALLPVHRDRRLHPARVLRIYDRNNQNTAIRFLDYVCQKLPFRVEAIQTDNGGEFGAQFHWHVLDRGIRHVYIKPAHPTPQRQGRAIPPHRRRRVLPTARRRSHRRHQAVHDKLAEWENYYNHHRPHGALGRTNPLRTATTEDHRPNQLTSLPESHI